MIASAGALLGDGLVGALGGGRRLGDRLLGDRRLGAARQAGLDEHLVAGLDVGGGDAGDAVGVGDDELRLDRSNVTSWPT